MPKLGRRPRVARNPGKAAVKESEDEYDESDAVKSYSSDKEFGLEGLFSRVKI
jgi:hypothetical protein